MSFFESISQLPEDPIFSIPLLFKSDPRPRKVNLGIGNYRDAEGFSHSLTCVKKVEREIAERNDPNEYLPIDGHAEFLKVSQELIFGQALQLSSNSFFAAQSIGGTGALRIGAEFLTQETSKAIFLPNPTWPNHKLVFSRSGMKVHFYRYYDEASQSLDFVGLRNDISNMPPGSTLLLHVNCHNPTGINPSYEQWKELSALIKQQKIIPFFDFAYQGFADNPEKDAEPIRLFVSEGHEMLLAYSFSKNFGLYSHRLGIFFMTINHKETISKVSSQIKQMIRSSYSNPPKLGADIVMEILKSDTLKEEWLKELANMRDRLIQMRHALRSGLQAKASHKDWSFLNRQKGFFSFCGLDQGQVHRLIKDYAIYLPANGRINVSGLNPQNIDYVIDAIVDVAHS